MRWYDVTWWENAYLQNKLLIDDFLADRRLEIRRLEEAQEELVDQLMDERCLRKQKSIEQKHKQELGGIFPRIGRQDHG